MPDSDETFRMTVTVTEGIRTRLTRYGADQSPPITAASAATKLIREGLGAAVLLKHNMAPTVGPDPPMTPPTTKGERA